MVRELYIDDQRVDLPDDVKFQLTFQIADFGDLSPRGSGSNTIKLPKTPRNVGIFERCNFVQVASNFPYALHSAYYYEDGFLVFNDATVYMLAITVVIAGEGAKVHSVSVQPTFNRIKDETWGNYIEMQQAYRKAKALFMLSPRDVAELDFKKPIYLRQYAQAYVVTKVNYQPHASTVELLLIR